MKMPIKENYYNNILMYYHVFCHIKKAKIFSIDKSTITPIKAICPKIELSIDKRFILTPNGRELDMFGNTINKENLI